MARRAPRAPKRQRLFLIMGKKRVFVAMSGGVDSSVAAALYREQGHAVIGVHIKMWSDPSIPCNFKEDRYDAMRVAEQIGIPFQTWDLTGEYRTAVVEYMIREYAAGRTPNPDVVCNRDIKFGVFLKRALELGADAVATGHYARLMRKSQNTSPIQSGTTLQTNHKTHPRLDRGPNYQLLTAKDTNKDQSYFLWTLTQEQLRHCLFPIGEYTKPEVRRMARERGLRTAEKKDSQGICFIGEIDLRAFLQKYIPVSRGPVLTTSGKAVGEHEGLSFYTIGQRQGLGIGGGPSPRRSGLWPREGGIPYYVAGKDFAANALVVAQGPYDEKLFVKEIAVADVNWISEVPPAFPLRCEARIRYRQPLQQAHVTIHDTRNTTQRTPQMIEKIVNRNTCYVIRFAQSQRAATPGQSVVFYRGEEMLGGGIIR